MPGHAYLQPYHITTLGGRVGRVSEKVHQVNENLIERTLLAIVQENTAWIWQDQILERQYGPSNY
jgi:hypothetical protein